MRKASSILLLVFLFLSNVSFANHGGGCCKKETKSCCEKKEKSCCEKETKSCCEKKAKRCHDAANCGYCQNKNHVCGEDCHPDPCPNHHCDGCYKGEATPSCCPDVARADHHCDGCHPQDKW